MKQYLEMVDEENEQLLSMREALMEEFSIEQELLAGFLQDASEQGASICKLYNLLVDEYVLLMGQFQSQ